MARRRWSLLVSLPAIWLGAGVGPRAMGEGLTNAALPKYGMRVSLHTGPKCGKDRHTQPEDTFDGNAHSRCVVWGEPPYSFTIELLDRLPVAKMAFAHSDYASEEAPKDLRIELDDGTALDHSLEVERPVRRRPAWQEVAVGKAAKVIKVTILSNHPGKVKWGGLAEIAVLTSADLDKMLAIPGYDPKAPVFVRLPAIETAAPAKVHLPPVVPPGEHPRCLLSKAELDEFRKAATTAERAKDAYKALIANAQAMCSAELDFPDPKGTPAQLKDRRCPIAKRHARLSRGCGSLAMAYALTGEAKYARRAREILLGYAERYAAYPEHKGVNRSDTGKVMAQRLSEAMWLIPQAHAYDLIRGGDVLSDDDRQRIEAGLLRPCVAFIRRKDPAQEVAERTRRQADWRTADPQPAKGRRIVGNWMTFYAAATMLAGAAMDDRDLIDLAAADARFAIANGIAEDGMWGEGAIGYQLFALQALVPVFETAARQGIDLWGYQGSRVKSLFDTPLRYAYPDGTAPGINDSGRVKLGNWSTMVYDYAWLRWRDPRHAVLVNQSPRQLHVSEGVYYPTRIYGTLPEPKAVTYPSMVFKSLGYAILRDQRLYALMDYGRHGGVHGHLDKLNLILFAGDELGGEPVMHRYEDALHAEWTRHTVAHNTMAVDERSQAPCTGKLLVFEGAGPIQVMRAEAVEAYPGVLLDRTVVVTPTAVIDLFHGRSQKPHTWDRTLRFHGTIPDLDADKLGDPLGTRDGYQHLKVASRVPAEKRSEVQWKSRVGELSVSVAGAPGQEAILAVGPDRDHIVLLRQKGAQASFAAALRLEKWGKAVEDAALRDTGAPAIVAFEMKQGDATIRVVVAHRSGEWKALGWASDARVLVVVERGGQLSALMAGGTKAAKGDKALRLPQPGNCFKRAL